MLSFFENPLPCALGHRTLCSTTRKYNCALPFVPSGCPSLPLQLELPHSRPGVALRRVRCRNFRCDGVRRNLVERPERLKCLGLRDCVLTLARFLGVALGQCRPCCSGASPCLEWTYLFARRGVGLVCVRLAHLVVIA